MLEEALTGSRRVSFVVFPWRDNLNRENRIDVRRELQIHLLRQPQYNVRAVHSLLTPPLATSIYSLTFAPLHPPHRSMFRAAMLGLAAFEGANALVVGTPAMQVNRVSTINMANIADTLATADGPEIFWGPDGPLQNPMKEESDFKEYDKFTTFLAACKEHGVDLTQPDITVLAPANVACEEHSSVSGPLTKLQCCPTSDGGACAIVCSEEFVKRHGLEGQAVEIIGMAMATDLRTTFDDKSCIKLIGADMSKTASQAAYKQAGIAPRDVQVLELHDCFSSNELLTYEALGLCREGEAGKFIDRGDNDYGGQVVVNPSGGLISKGHPLGATGLAQCAEMCWQLRGEADKRQVPNAKVAMSHNLGLGGAVVVTMYVWGAA